MGNNCDIHPGKCPRARRNISPLGSFFGDPRVRPMGEFGTSFFNDEGV
jgi:hypothetical protein